MKSLFTNFLNWFSSKNKWKLIGIAILFKLIQAFLFASWADGISPDLMVNDLVLKHADYNYFLAPVDHFFEDGSYYLKEGQCYAGRMPGYWFIYMLLRFVLSASAALNTLIVLQIVLSGIAVFYLAKVANSLFKSERVFALTYLLFLLSSFTSVFDFQTISESFSVPAFIFSLYFLSKYITESEGQKKHLILSGLFLTWSIFLRPYLGIFLVIYGLIIIWQERKSIGKLVLNGLVFAIPFVVIETAWVVRNYNSCQEIILLQQKPSEAYGKNYSDGWIAARTLFHSWGEGGEYFEPGSCAEWFKIKEIELTNQFKPEYFENVEYEPEDIIRLKRMYHEFYEKEGYDVKLDETIVDLSNMYINQYKAGNPFAYYFTQRWNAFKRLILHSGSSYVPLPPFQEMNLFQKFLKLFYSSLYYIVVIFGFVGILLARTQIPLLKRAMFIMLLSLILALVFLSTIQEARYFIVGFTILIPFTAGVMDKTLSILKFD